MNSIFEITIKELMKAGILRCEREKLLSASSTFRIGGPAEYALYPTNEKAFIEAYLAAKEAGYTPRVLGCCSNILFPDEGVRGVLIFTGAMNGSSADGTTVRAAAGKSVTLLSSEVQKQGLSGMEFYYGIPGSVGGAVYMNAGAYEHETAEILVRSRCFFPDTGMTATIEGQEHNFSYRHSVYMKNGGILLSAEYSLRPDDPKKIKERMEDYMQRRKDKQPLDKPSAGSVFKRYPGYYTGKLIAEAGLKGYKIGGAAVSTKHAGFIVNEGGATAEEVKALVAHIQKVIYERNGIMIERELIYF